MSAAEVVPFDYNGYAVRTVLLEGEPWFVAKDVCDRLEVKDVSMALRSLDEDEKGTSSVGTPGGLQELSIVSESGLYSLTLRSRKPEAKAFKRWVTHEVLPALRKHGTYAVPGRETEVAASVADVTAVAVAVAVRQVELEFQEREDSKLAECGLYRNPVTGVMDVRPDPVATEAAITAVTLLIQAGLADDLKHDRGFTTEVARMVRRAEDRVWEELPPGFYFQSAEQVRALVEAVRLNRRNGS